MRRHVPPRFSRRLASLVARELNELDLRGELRKIAQLLAEMAKPITVTVEQRPEVAIVQYARAVELGRLSASDLQFLETRRFPEDEVATVFSLRDT